MTQRYSGISIIELLVALAVIGVLAGIGVQLLPRQGMAVSQGQRIFASAIQFARFEAIKRNQELEVSFEEGSGEIIVRRTADGVEFRSFPLDPQGGRVVVKSSEPDGIMTFNARGVSVVPLARTVSIGIPGSDTYNRALLVSGQGTVRSGP